MRGSGVCVCMCVYPMCMSRSLPSTHTFQNLTRGRARIALPAGVARGLRHSRRHTKIRLKRDEARHPVRLTSGPPASGTMCSPLANRCRGGQGLAPTIHNDPNERPYKPSHGSDSPASPRGNPLRVQCKGSKCLPKSGFGWQNIT